LGLSIITLKTPDSAGLRLGGAHTRCKRALASTFGILKFSTQHFSAHHFFDKSLVQIPSRILSFFSIILIDIILTILRSANSLASRLRGDLKGSNSSFDRYFGPESVKPTDRRSFSENCLFLTTPCLLS
jgi:hypothetical protein